MKRYSGLHDKLCTIENIEVADDNARKNKNKKYGINKHDKNRQYENTKYDWRIYTKNRKENIKPQI
nr:MAG: MatK/TrnK amino terminal region [Bacteriophage sp.]